MKIFRYPDSYIEMLILIKEDVKRVGAECECSDYECCHDVFYHEKLGVIDEIISFIKENKQ